MTHKFAYDVDHSFLQKAYNNKSKKCKECWGRGYQTYDLGKGTRIRVKHCSCVERNISKNMNAK